MTNFPITKEIRMNHDEFEAAGSRGFSSFASGHFLGLCHASCVIGCAASLRRWFLLAGWLLLCGAFFGGATPVAAQTTVTTNSASLMTGLMPIRLNLGVEAAQQPQDVDVAIKVLFVITLLTLAPSIILLMTCFTRIVIVLSFVRSALSLQGTPGNQIIIGLSLFITYFIMEPVWSKIDTGALQPYMAKQISGEQALSEAAKPIRAFMLRQARPKDVELFVGLANLAPKTPEDLPLKVVIPGFVISELRTAFQMGFLLFVPFILIDLVV